MMIKKKVFHKRRGTNILELLVTTVIFIIVSTPVVIVFRMVYVRYGLFPGILCGVFTFVISCSIVAVLTWVIVKIAESNEK